MWICPDPRGHLQAIGTDAAGRRQYRYHEAWRTRRDAEKFDRVLRFARALPALRDRVAADLAATDELARERVLACAVRLLDRGFFRIGGEEYAERNESYGLSTIEKRHVRFGDDGEVVFDYIAKSGKHRVQRVIDPDAAAVLAPLKRRRTGDDDLLAWREGGRWVDVASEDVNAYLKQHAGAGHSAKDFRTWNGTVLAAVALAVAGPAARSETARKRAVSRAVKEVSDYLGNTPAVARAAYIDPRLFDRYRDGLTVAGTLEELGDVGVFGEPAFQGRVETAVLHLIEDEEGEAFEEVVPVEVPA